LKQRSLPLNFPWFLIKNFRVTSFTFQSSLKGEFIFRWDVSKVFGLKSDSRSRRVMSAWFGEKVEHVKRRDEIIKQKYLKWDRFQESNHTSQRIKFAKTQRAIS